MNSLEEKTEKTTELTRQELLEMIEEVLNAGHGMDTIRMSYSNAKKLGMPAKVFGCKIIAMDDPFPEHYILAGGDE